MEWNFQILFRCFIAIPFLNPNYSFHQTFCKKNPDINYMLTHWIMNIPLHIPLILQVSWVSNFVSRLSISSSHLPLVDTRRFFYITIMIILFVVVCIDDDRRVLCRRSTTRQQQNRRHSKSKQAMRGWYSKLWYRALNFSSRTHLSPPTPPSISHLSSKTGRFVLSVYGLYFIKIYIV